MLYIYILFTNLLRQIIIFFFYNASFLKQTFLILGFHFVIVCMKMKEDLQYTHYYTRFKFFFPFCFSSQSKRISLYAWSTCTQIYAVCPMYTSSSYVFFYWYVYSNINVPMKKIYHRSLFLFQKCIADIFLLKNIMYWILLFDFSFYNYTIFNKKLKFKSISFFMHFDFNLLYKIILRIFLIF